MIDGSYRFIEPPDRPEVPQIRHGHHAMCQLWKSPECGQLDEAKAPVDNQSAII